MLLDVRLLFMVANVVRASGRGGGKEALLIAFVLVYYSM